MGKHPRRAASLQTMQIRAAFAAAWQAGQRPRICGVSSATWPNRRGHGALRELVALDIEYRRQAGETADASRLSGSASRTDREPDRVALRDDEEPDRSGASGDARAAAGTGDGGSEPLRSRSLKTAPRRPDRQTHRARLRRRPPREIAVTRSWPLAKFCDAMVTSGLMSHEEIEAFLESLPADRRPQNGKQLAQELFRAKRLTRFQAQAVYQGKTAGW